MAETTTSSVEDKLKPENLRRRTESAGEVINDRVSRLKSKAGGLLAEITGLKDKLTGMDDSAEKKAELEKIESRIGQIEKKIEELAEWEAKREVALANVRNGISVLDRVVNNEPEGADKKYLNWALGAVRYAYDNAKDDDKVEFEIKAGADSQKEGVSVNILVEALKLAESKISNHTKKADCASVIRDLEASNSVKKSSDVRGAVPEWRIQHEANLIAGDPSRFAREGSYANNPGENYNRAKQDLDSRLELKIADLPAMELPPEVATSPEVAVVAAADAPTPITVEQIKLQINAFKVDKKVFVIDVQEIAKRLAWTQAETKLEVLKKSWRSKIDAPATPPTSRWGKFKEMAKGIFGAGKDVNKNWKDLGRSVWVRLSENEYLQKFYVEALDAIMKNQNLKAEIEARVRKSKVVEGTDVNRQRIASQEILDDVLTTFSDGLETDEERGELLEAARDSESKMTDLIFGFATGHITEAQLNIKINEIVSEKRFHQLSGSKDVEAINNKRINKKTEKVLTDNEKFYAGNVVAIALQYREKYAEIIEACNERATTPEDKEAITSHFRKSCALDIQLGRKARDVRDTRPLEITTWTDKAVEVIQRVPILGKLFASPAVVGAGVGVGMALFARRGASWTLRTGLKTLEVSAAVGASALGALMGGAIGAMRRGRDLQYARGRELRGQALGQESGNDTLRTFSQKIYKVDVITENLKRYAEKYTSATDEGKKDIENNIAETYARLAIETEENRDMFSASDSEKDRGTRISSMNQLRKALKAVEQSFGEEFINSLSDKINTIKIELMGELSGKDTKFKSYRRREMVKAAAIGAVMGGAAGFVAYEAMQEIYHLMGDVKLAGAMTVATKNIPEGAVEPKPIPVVEATPKPVIVPEKPNAVVEVVSSGRIPEHTIHTERGGSHYGDIESTKKITGANMFPDDPEAAKAWDTFRQSHKSFYGQLENDLKEMGGQKKDGAWKMPFGVKPGAELHVMAIKQPDGSYIFPAGYKLDDKILWHGGHSPVGAHTEVNAKMDSARANELLKQIQDQTKGATVVEPQSEASPAKIRAEKMAGMRYGKTTYADYQAEIKNKFGDGYTSADPAHIKDPVLAAAAANKDIFDKMIDRLPTEDLTSQNGAVERLHAATAEYVSAHKPDLNNPADVAALRGAMDRAVFGGGAVPVEKPTPVLETIPSRTRSIKFNEKYFYDGMKKKYGMVEPTHTGTIPPEVVVGVLSGSDWAKGLLIQGIDKLGPALDSIKNQVEVSSSQLNSLFDNGINKVKDFIDSIPTEPTAVDKVTPYTIDQIKDGVSAALNWLSKKIDSIVPEGWTDILQLSGTDLPPINTTADYAFLTSDAIGFGHEPTSFVKILAAEMGSNGQPEIYQGPDGVKYMTHADDLYMQAGANDPVRAKVIWQDGKIKAIVAAEKSTSGRVVRVKEDIVPENFSAEESVNTLRTSELLDKTWVLSPRVLSKPGLAERIQDFTDSYVQKNNPNVSNPADIEKYKLALQKKFKGESLDFGEKQDVNKSAVPEKEISRRSRAGTIREKSRTAEPTSSRQAKVETPVTTETVGGLPVHVRFVELILQGRYEEALPGVNITEKLKEELLNKAHAWDQPLGDASSDPNKDAQLAREILNYRQGIIDKNKVGK